jgi:16S rRNA (cytosine967-C5)-methyltransferase
MSKNAGTSSPRKSKSSSADRPSARDLAARVLVRVFRDRAFAAAALHAELASQPQLDGRDAALATELVYGVLRMLPPLEQRIAAHATSDRWQKQPLVRAHVCIGAYSLLALDRVPDFSAVDEAVEAIKRASDRRVAGFANAVLRKIAREGGRLDPLEALPPWLRTALEAVAGEEGLSSLVGSPAPLCLCLRSGEDRATWLERLREAAPAASWRLGALSPRCILGDHTGDVQRLPGIETAWIVQEEGAQAVALLVGAGPGDEVLDACAGRGGKTLLLSEAVENGAVDAADLHPKKLDRLRRQPGGGRIRDTFAVDWTRGSGGISRLYDRILVDAPCTGTGTLRRRPEIAQRLEPGDVERLSAVQIAIVRRTAAHLKPGGRLVYAVCSVLRAECEEVVEAVTGDGLLTPCPFDGPLSGLTTESALRLLPSAHGTDGFFVACFTRR